MIQVTVDKKDFDKFFESLKTIATPTTDKIAKIVQAKAKENVDLVTWRGGLKDSIRKTPSSGGVASVFSTAPYAIRFGHAQTLPFTGFEPANPVLSQWADDKVLNTKAASRIKRKGTTVNYGNKGPATRFMDNAAESITQPVAESIVKTELSKISEVR